MKTGGSAKTLLTNAERGQPSFSLCPTPERRWTFKHTFELSDSVQYLRGKEDYLLSLSTSGTLVFHSSAKIPLTQPPERVIKFILTQEIFVVSLCGSSLLRFSKFDLNALRSGEIRREDVLPHLSLELNALKQVDLASQCIIIQDLDHVSAWQLQTGRKIGTVPGQFGRSVWYSDRHLIHLFSQGSQKILTVANLVSDQTKQCKLPPAADLLQAQVCGQSLALVFRNCQAQVLDLTTGALRSLGTGVPRLLLETESRSDALASFSSGESYLLSRPNCPISVAVRNPIFTDIEELALVLENDVCTVINTEARVLDRFPVYANSQVTAVGINEDTWEILVACSDGKVQVYQ